MSPGIADLPNELLTAIFHRVHAFSHSALISCVGCCQHWKDLAEPILWRNIFLRFHNSRRFSAQIRALSESEQGRRKLKTVRCLRIAIPGNGRDYAGGVHDRPSDNGADDTTSGVSQSDESRGRFNYAMVDSTLRPRRSSSYVLIAQGLSDLELAVPYLASLHTFHLLVYNGVKMNGPDDRLGSIAHREKTPGPCPDMFVSLLNTLPLSVRDLCLDLSDATRRFPRDKCRFCPAVNELLPRLEHLALYLRSCCVCILRPEASTSPSGPNLKSVIMRLQGFQSKECRLVLRQQQRQFAHFDVKEYCRLVQIARASGAFPSLESFLIISKRRLVGADNSDVSSRWAVYVKDLACNQTVVFPRVFLEKPNTVAQGVTRTYSPRAMIRIPSTCSFMPTWLLGNEYVGGSGGIRRLVSF